MIKIDALNFRNARHEKKFLISTLDSQEVEGIINLHPSIFSQIFHQRNINNIYLDSFDKKNYHANINGVSQRLKIRIRWYGQLFGKIKKPVIELKIKNHELSKKISYPLKSFILDETFSITTLKNVFLRSDLPAWLLEKLKSYHFSLLNRYQRKYFISANRLYRITIDKDLKFFNLSPYHNSFKEVFTDFHTVLEIKCAQKNFDGLTNITQHFPFRLTKNSKYVFGMDLLHSL